MAVTLAAACLVLGVPACGSGGDQPGPATGVAPDVVGTDALAWGDDDAHLLVSTSRSAVADGREPSDGTVLVHHGDGTIEMMAVSAESLVAEAPLDARERQALAGAGPGAVIVIDVRGVVGAAMSRYVMVGDELTEITFGGAAATTTGSDATITARISALVGVHRAVSVGPGIIAVAADASDTALVDRIGAVDGVIDVAVDVLSGPTTDPLQDRQWAIRNNGSPAQAGNWPGVVAADTAAPAAWTVTKGAGVTVAVIDTGVELTHPDLASRVWANAREICANGLDDDHNGYVDDCNGWDFGNNEKNPNPDAGATSAEHGTHVAGIIAASANNVGTVGVAPEATIMALKVANTSGGMAESSLVAAIDYASANGAKVINMSLGTPLGYGRADIAPEEDAIKRATTNGVTVVVASGNTGIDITTNSVWPAGLSVYNTGVITVGASTNSDTLAYFSNTGAPVNLVAPGWWILSSILDSGWGSMSGTSMATPYVAGGAALVLASGNATTPAAVRSRLIATTDATAAGKRLNVAAAVGTTRAVGITPVLGVSYSSTLAADVEGSLAVQINAPATSGVSQVRLSVATRVGGVVAAVEGLDASFTDTTGSLGTGATNDRGAFAAIPLRDPTALSAAGTTLDAMLNLPAGEYAFVTELLNAGGTTVAGAQVAYLSISAPAGTGGGAVPATTVASNPIPTTAPSAGATPSTTVPGWGGGTTVTTRGGSGGATTSSLPAGGSAPTTAPHGATTTTTAHAGSTTATTAAAVTTTTRAGTGSPAVTTAPDDDDRAGARPDRHDPPGSHPGRRRRLFGRFDHSTRLVDVRRRTGDDQRALPDERVGVRVVRRRRADRHGHGDRHPSDRDRSGGPRRPQRGRDRQVHHREGVCTVPRPGVQLHDGDLRRDDRTGDGCAARGHHDAHHHAPGDDDADGEHPRDHDEDDDASGDRQPTHHDGTADHHIGARFHLSRRDRYSWPVDAACRERRQRARRVERLGLARHRLPPEHVRRLDVVSTSSRESFALQIAAPPDDEIVVPGAVNEPVDSPS